MSAGPFAIGDDVVFRTREYVTGRVLEAWELDSPQGGRYLVRTEEGRRWVFGSELVLGSEAAPPTPAQSRLMRMRQRTRDQRVAYERAHIRASESEAVIPAKALRPEQRARDQQSGRILFVIVLLLLLASLVSRVIDLGEWGNGLWLVAALAALYVYLRLDGYFGSS